MMKAFLIRLMALVNTAAIEVDHQCSFANIISILPIEKSTKAKCSLEKGKQEQEHKDIEIPLS
jgi:hypothetical protein